MALDGKPGMSDPQERKGTGLGIDASGGPVIDPTANVIALNEAANKRQDDLRDLTDRLTDAKIAHQKEIGDIRDAHQKEISNLRAVHAETLRVSDLDRLDKTRQVDVLAGTASAATLATAVATLANTSDRNAETLRNLVNVTAQTMAKQTSDQAATLSAQTDSLVKDINARIAELQKASYQGVGKSSVADPQMERLAAMVEALARSRDTVTGKSEGIGSAWVFLLGGVGLIGTLIGIAGALYAALK